MGGPHSSGCGPPKPCLAVPRSRRSPCGWRSIGRLEGLVHGPGRSPRAAVAVQSAPLSRLTETRLDAPFHDLLGEHGLLGPGHVREQADRRQDRRLRQLHSHELGCPKGTLLPPPKAPHDNWVAEDSRLDRPGEIEIPDPEARAGGTGIGCLITGRKKHLPSGTKTVLDWSQKSKKVGSGRSEALEKRSSG